MATSCSIRTVLEPGGPIARPAEVYWLRSIAEQLRGEAVPRNSAQSINTTAQLPQKTAVVRFKASREQQRWTSSG